MSVVNESSFHEQMPGYHYARLMAVALKSEPEDAERIQESARFLLGQIDASTQGIEALHRACNQFADILNNNPEMIHAHPGDGYWPLQTLSAALERIGLSVTFNATAVSS